LSFPGTSGIVAPPKGEQVGIKLPMKIGIPKERRPNEARVAVSPDTVKKLIALGAEVVVEAGAGAASAVPDGAYAAVGARIAHDEADALSDADIVLKVQRPLTAGEGGPDELALMKPGALLIGILAPYAAKEQLGDYAGRNISAFAMEFLPRVTRAQTMDVLSSQANLAGYRAVIEAASVFGRGFPMMMTAAGTVAAARVLVMGAGVAGLQAIATARRLGAVVSATDVRPAAKEQVQSLGATFVAVEDEEFKQAETAGGYAKEMSDAYRAKQAALIAETDHQETGRDHHHRTHPRPQGAHAGERGDGEEHEARLRHRRSGGGAGRQLPALRAR
jgi:NAD(P) transhydrogenase subunit alpha